MKDKMRDISATPSAVIATVATQLEPDVLMALPKKLTPKRTLNRKRQKLQSDSGANLPPLPTDMSLTVPDQFQDLLLFDSGSGSDRLVLLGKRIDVARGGGGGGQGLGPPPPPIKVPLTINKI